MPVRRAISVLACCVALLPAQPSVLSSYTRKMTVVAGSYHAGMEALKKGDYGAAARHLQQCARAPAGEDSDEWAVSADCADGLAWILQLEGRLDEAAHVLDRLESRGTTVRIWRSVGIWGRARLLHVAGRRAEAQRVLEEGLKNFSAHQVKSLPTVRELLNVQAELLLEAGAVQSSRAVIEKARVIRWSPQEQPDRLARGRLERVSSQALLAEGRRDEAAAAARAALELHRKDQAAEAWDVQMDRLALAEVRRGQGQAKEAGELYQQAFQTLTARLGPAQPDARRALERLATLLDEVGQAADAGRVRATLAQLPRPECRICAAGR